ncbi:MAG TPA: DUF58 domain-containing protein [Thiothrix sp.]|nr:DUF58 domain-containing protein [Thiothrix sp.]
MFDKQSTRNTHPPKKSDGRGLVWVDRDDLLAMQSTAQALTLSKSKIRSRQAGQHLSPFKGRGMDFAESRPYQAGDDIRTLDWRVTARTNRPHTKVFQEERERPVLLWVDMRDAMFFATQGVFKSVLAAELAALIAWKTRADGDRIGGMLAQSDTHIEAKPSNTRKGLVRFLQQLALSSQSMLRGMPERQQETSLADHLRRLRRVVATGSRVYLLSDFRGLDKAAQRQLIAIKHKADVILLHIYDPFEQHIPALNGELMLSDGQGQQRMLINLQQKKGLRDYYHRAEQRQQSLKSFCRNYHLGLIHFETHESAKRRLQKLMVLS